VGTLVVDDLSVRYGPVQALRDVSMQAEAGMVTAVLGANGAGKTSLLRAITGLTRPAGGAVRYEDTDLTRLSVEDVVRHGVAHVPEGRGVIEELTVEENLRLGGLWRPRADRRRSLDEVLALFTVLAPRLRRLAATLSGGERQALAIGRALMASPSLLLLDEPSLGLAPLVTAQLMQQLVTLTRDHGITVVLVEQNVRTALSIAAEAVVLNLGQVVVRERAEVLAGDAELRRHFLGF
jgi:branched-chain amino acid transport system ATP-binding protein